MKRVCCILFSLLLLIGCGQKVISPSSTSLEIKVDPTATPSPTASPTEVHDTPAPSDTPIPRPALATYAPVANEKALFAEELLSQDGEPIGSQIRSLLHAEDLSKQDFYDRFQDIIRQSDDLDAAILELSSKGRTLTADRREKTADSLMKLMSQEVLDSLQNAYSKCRGTGEELPLSGYAGSMDALLQDVQGMEERTIPFFGLGTDSAQEYKAVIDRYVGESVLPRTLLSDMEALAETEAYAIHAALQADPEAARKKEAISLGSFAENIAFLCRVTEELCPLPDGSALPIPRENEAAGETDLLALAFRYYPGMEYLKLYAAKTSEDQRLRWANAPDGSLVGLAIHGSFAITPYLKVFGLEYVQYRWYEDMLDATLTGISALLIHYYGYSKADLAAYLQSWGAAEFTDYLYAKAMSDPFDSLVAAFGYYRYLDIAEAALASGCESERCFLQDYLSAGPAPYEALKEYMVGLYQNKVDKDKNGE